MSFGWNVMFRTGSWLEFRSFLLKQRKNVPSRLRAIELELARIGSVSVVFQSIEEGKVSERRTGLKIESGTSLGKLMRAYVARGGNYYDISMFLTPDSYSYAPDEEGRAIYNESQPYGGVVFPEGIDQEEDQAGLAGALILWKDPKRKLEQKGSIWDSDEANQVGQRVLSARGWATQEIKELRNDLEARIIKLCDLREQLLKERGEIIITALGGTLPSLEYNPEHYLAQSHLSNIVSVFDQDFFETDSEGVIDFSRPKPYVNKTYQAVLVEDTHTGEEKYTAL